MSSSLVAKVLRTTAKIEAADLKDKISEIQKEIILLKTDVNQFIDDNYVDFLAKVEKDTILIERADKLVDNMKGLKNRIEDQIKVELSGSTKELKSLSQALEASNLSLDLSSQLLELHTSLKTVDKLQQEKRYVEAARVFKRMQRILNKREDNDLKLLNIYPPIRDCYFTAYSTFLSTIKGIWEQTVCWSDHQGSEPSSKSNKDNSISLRIDCQPKQMQDLLQALHYAEELSPSLQFFCTKILKRFIIPIIHYDCSVYVAEKTVFNVNVLNEKQSPTYKSTLHNLKLLFQFLNQHFQCNVEEKTFIGLISGQLFERLEEELIKNCVSKTIPDSSAELQNFREVEENVQEFENYLVEIGFVRPEELFLSQYISNIDHLYIDKKCQGLLNTAREIMKKDLHDAFKYEPEVPEFPLLQDKLSDRNPSDTIMERKLSKNTFQLPSCQISKSAREILELVRSILDEVTRSPEACSVRLYYTSRNIFEMYAGAVPEYHKKFLETIPQQVALFHNNCMYFAHHLMTLGHEYHDKIPTHLEKHNVTYVDLTLKLRAVGAEYFMNHMKYQRNIITEIIRDSGLSQLGQSSKLPPGTERALRQCVRQLELLKTVWSEVLPVNTYCKALGCITNSMIEDLVLKVITVEDIPAAVATELVGLFNIIVKRVPAIFPDPHAINRNVSKWQKLLELIKILEASLRDIQDRWADGKGPLAHEFTSTQVKQLIRALFQNTERRAALLATIK
ncbi:centromere/kinetochore protein zw10 homolog [Diachasma alloeum]|uniref:centromere/kinetochore protein zw10 homolog n=1 Tax=Diachasma alloeum TaxID=454923 RepID=UPI0007381F8A|nr:centromere/kinetochore protein zw10 homolog [Diachasma alloeum]